MSSFSDALSSAAREKRNVAVLFMDVDRFKYVNDSLGTALAICCWPYSAADW